MLRHSTENMPALCPLLGPVTMVSASREERVLRDVRSLRSPELQNVPLVPGAGGSALSPPPHPPTAGAPHHPPRGSAPGSGVGCPAPGRLQATALRISSGSESTPATWCASYWAPGSEQRVWWGRRGPRTVTPAAGSRGRGPQLHPPPLPACPTQ